MRTRALKIMRIVAPLVCGLFASSMTVRTMAEEPLRIVSWNAREVFSPSVASSRREDFEAFAQEVKPDILLLQEVNSHAVVERIRDLMGLDGYHVYCSNFETNDAPSHSAFEVAVISRIPAFQAIEFDPTPDNSGDEVDLEESPMPKLTKLGLEDVPTSRGFLWVHFPQLRMTVMNVHLKSSGGSSGGSDRNNAAKRELVAAAVADSVNEDLGFFPNHTHVVLGDFNVGHSDESKNGLDVADDTNDGYDDTHALLHAGIVNGLKMRNLIGHITTPTYPDFPGTPIDNIYVVGSHATGMENGTVVEKTFGSDHRPVACTFTPSGPSDSETIALGDGLEDFPNVRGRASSENVASIFGIGEGEQVANSIASATSDSATVRIERLEKENQELKATLEELKAILQKE
jgi:endonuclease/exonuclease/phosphatase family metal-dependent hydrolase